MSAASLKRLGYLCLLCLLAGCSTAPEPLTEDQIELIAQQDRDLIFKDQEAYEGTLTLERAMALALKYNLENRVRLMEEIVADNQLDMSEIELLPSLATSAGYLDRDRPNASRSESVNTGDESLEPSTSQDLQRTNASARATWNLLDFGVSYLQLKQDTDRYLIAQKTREKIMLTLMKEVRAAYWRAVAMEQMRGELEDISQQVDEMLAYWQSVREQRLRAPVAVLMDIRSLIETRQQLDDIRSSINTAQARLGNLINAPRFREISLPVVTSFPELDDAASNIEAMEMIALKNSADYISEVYKVRIDHLETRKAMRRLWPGLEFSYGKSYDSNSFLVFSDWNEFGINLTHDLTRLMFTERLKRFREVSEELAVARKLAVNMAVVTGVHITWQDYQNSLIRLERAEYLQGIDEQISDLTSNAQMNAKESGAAAIQTRLRAFRSKIGRMQSYADAQAAFGEYMVSLGINPIPEGYQQLSIEELADRLETNIEIRMHPFSAEGEALLAEAAAVDEWVAPDDEESQPVEVIAEAESEAAMEEETVNSDTDLTVAVLNPTAADVTLPDVNTPSVHSVDGAEETETPETTEESMEVAARDNPFVEAVVMEVTSVSPDATAFMTDFLVKYFPKPQLQDYLQQFERNL